MATVGLVTAALMAAGCSSMSEREQGTAKGAACKVLSAHTDYHLGLTATPIYNITKDTNTTIFQFPQYLWDTVLVLYLYT